MAELFNLSRGYGSALPQSGVGNRWLAAIEGMDDGRLRRGRSYARSGHVTNVVLTDNGVLARVRGSAYTPYQVRVSLPAIPPEVWEKVLEAIATDVSLVAMLLSGQIPPEVEQVLARYGQVLFPDTSLYSEDDCTCYDWSRPCKHIAAVYYVLADVLAADPQLIFTLRGLPKEQLLERLEAIRDRLLEERFGTEPGSGEAGEGVAADQSPDFWVLGAPLESIELRGEPPGIHAVPLKALGPAPYGYERRDFMSKAEQLYGAISRAGVRLLAARVAGVPVPLPATAEPESAANLFNRRQ